MDDAGNILIRRYSKTNVFVKSTATNPNDETAIGAEILKLPNNAIESEKIVKVSAHTHTPIQLTCDAYLFEMSTKNYIILWFRILLHIQFAYSYTN